MLTCIPQSNRNWDFRVQSTSAGLVELNFELLTENGQIQLGNDQYQIRKHGWTSGHWTLEANGECIADAHQRNPFFRTFEVVTAGKRLTVKAKSRASRCFEILESNSPLGTIRPMHPFTRRSVVDCSTSVPELIQLFCFWLAALMWRRGSLSYNI